MTREELQHDFNNEQGINWLNSQGEPDIDYVMWLENKILAIKNNTPLPPAEGAEEMVEEKLKYNKVIQQRDELKEALAEMIWQFGYRSTYEGRESLHTGGLSALESAFGALGLSDPIALLDFEAAIKNTDG